MDTNNWRPTQVGEPSMDAGDWRSQLQPDLRQIIVNKIMDTLKRHLPFSGQEGLQELKNIALKFEEKFYTAATSRPDYLQKISSRMLKIETKSQNTIPNSVESNSAEGVGEGGAGDWRSQLQPDSRQRIVNKIMDTLKMHLPFSGQEGLLKKIALRFEETIYTAATSQSDYLRKISLEMEMLAMETKSQNSIPNSVQSNSAGNSNSPPDPGLNFDAFINNYACTSSEET